MHYVSSNTIRTNSHSGALANVHITVECRWLDHIMDKGQSEPMKKSLSLSLAIVKAYSQTKGLSLPVTVL